MIAKEKRIWCEDEDQALKKLYEEEGDKSWSNIAKRLSSDFNFPRKSAKQCRQRYENHINCEGVKIQWNQDEEFKLIDLHNQMGNKWSSIAENIPGKTDNCVKNHFYSKLRKILRKLNSVIHSCLRREYRPINIGTLYKIVEATEQRFKEEPSCGHQVSITCQCKNSFDVEVQNKMLHVSMLREEEFETEDRQKIYSDLVRQIYSVSKLYKRKSKKIRNSAIQAPNTRKKRMRQSNVIASNSAEQGYDSDSSSVFQEEEGQEDSGPIRPRREIEPEPQIIVKEVKKDIVIQQRQEGIRDMLKEVGLLKEEQDDGARSMFRYSSRSSFKSYSDRNDSANQFFEDSQNERGKRSKRRMSFERYRSSMLDDPSDKSEREGFDIAFG